MNNGSKDFFAFFKAVKNIAYRKSEKKEEKKTHANENSRVKMEWKTYVVHRGLIY